MSCNHNDGWGEGSSWLLFLIALASIGSCSALDNQATQLERIADHIAPKNATE